MCKKDSSLEANLETSSEISRDNNIHWVIEERGGKSEFVYIKKIIKTFNLDYCKEIFPSYATKTTPNDSATVEYKIRNKTLIQCTSFANPIQISKNKYISKLNEVNMVQDFKVNNLKYFIRK
ncbi:MAG: hypothetical protein QM610_01690 [Chitinophagaceae bacterium]